MAVPKPGDAVSETRPPGWLRLWRHSYRLGFRWLFREAAKGWPAGRTGFVRLVVPLDPWRFYELGRAADEDFSGKCLDISSPKLLPSLLSYEVRGDWTCTDLFTREIDAWRQIDPDLDLEVQDATALDYADATFDHVVCMSVLEHIGHGGDLQAMREMWRVLKPGGSLHLTTDVSVEPRDVYTQAEPYGEASHHIGGRVLFKHDYSIEEFDTIVMACPWIVRAREYAVLRRPRIESLFYAYRPWTYALGPFLRWICSTNFLISDSPAILGSSAHGVVYVHLQKPTRLGPTDD